MMGVRRKTENRLNLIRTCHTCGKTFSTTAASPWMRQLPNIDGKKQKICYFCSSACFAKSYKKIGFYDGKADQRRKERAAERESTDAWKRHKQENWKKYYAEHKEEICARRRARYWADAEDGRAESAYYRRKRALMKTAREVD